MSQKAARAPHRIGVGCESQRVTALVPSLLYELGLLAISRQLEEGGSGQAVGRVEKPNAQPQDCW
jgi:hypothetical protein